MARVLVIEGNELVRTVLQLEPREAGHDVHSAADGPLGIASVKDGRPDVVILDLSMPGMDVEDCFVKSVDLTPLIAAVGRTVVQKKSLHDEA